MQNVPRPALRTDPSIVRASGVHGGSPPPRVVEIAGARSRRTLPEEVAIAFTCNGATQAVMMATPADLDDFAVGFLHTEGLTRGVPTIERIDHANGIELRAWLDDAEAGALAARRRLAAGPVGCGLCGIESLDQAARDVATVGEPLATLGDDDIRDAVLMLRDHQPLHRETGATHAAAFHVPGRGIVHVREDVGRHNALDKLVGALLRAGVDPRSGAVVLTSRVSVEMVQKTAAFGCPVLIAVSAPTDLAVRTAETARITLVTNARGGDHRVRCHPHRIEGRTED